MEKNRLQFLNPDPWEYWADAWSEVLTKAEVEAQVKAHPELADAFHCGSVTYREYANAQQAAR